MLKYLLLLFSICAFAQTPNFTFTPDSDTDTYSRVQKANTDFGYDPVEDDNGDYSFRISTPSMVVTVYKLDTLCFGSIAFGAHEMNDFSNDYSGKKFKMQFALTRKESTAILDLIKQTQIDTIPTDKLIPGWQYGFDGTTFILQHKKDAVYSLKKYWSPWAQRNVPEAVKIEYFTTQISSILKISGYRTIFEKTIPFRMWTYGGSTIIGKPFKTKQEYRDYKRRKRAYEKSQE